MSQTIYELEVPAGGAGQRLDVWLAAQELPLSRAQLKRRIEEGEVQVDGASAKAGKKLRPGQKVRLCLAPEREVADLPEPIPLEILYEDGHLIVLNKPAGLVVHPAPGHESGTLVNALLHHCGRLPVPKGPPQEEADEEDEAGPEPARAGLSVGGERRPGIVHRLDQGTSGVLVCAKNDRALAGLQEQFQKHTIERAYLALVSGSLPERGTFSTRYGRHPQDRKRFTSRSGARHAVTHYVVLEAHPHSSLVEVRLETGRTHQIRVHLSEAGHKVIGDPLYGGRSRVALIETVGKALGHQALHARLLGFIHPVTGEHLCFTAPPPADFVDALQRLREG